MINLIKNFRQILPRQFQVIILAFLSVLAIIIRVEGQTDVLDGLFAFLPIALIVFAVYVLESKHKTLVSHLVLFLFVFSDYLGSFIRALFSYNFSTKVFVTPLSWQMILGLIACVYLILLILSYLLTEGLYLKYVKSDVLLPIILVFIYLYLRFSMATAVITIIPIVIVFLVNLPLAVVALLLSFVITVPIDVIYILIDELARFTTVFYWLVTALAFYLIFLLIKKTLNLVHKNNNTGETKDE
ncbi:MAG: hypothetical protein NUK62_04430 [Tenericutes bacterium]|nr:hypothetical protein [Mycoplasmatota bacterium]